LDAALTASSIAAQASRPQDLDDPSVFEIEKGIRHVQVGRWFRRAAWRVNIGTLLSAFALQRSPRRILMGHNQLNLQEMDLRLLQKGIGRVSASVRAARPEKRRESIGTIFSLTGFSHVSLAPHFDDCESCALLRQMSDVLFGNSRPSRGSRARHSRKRDALNELRQTGQIRRSRCLILTVR